MAVPLVLHQPFDPLLFDVVHALPGVGGDFENAFPDVIVGNCPVNGAFAHQIHLGDVGIFQLVEELLEGEMPPFQLRPYTPNRG